MKLLIHATRLKSKHVKLAPWIEHRPRLYTVKLGDPPPSIMIKIQHSLTCYIVLFLHNGQYIHAKLSHKFRKGTYFGMLKLLFCCMWWLTVYVSNELCIWTRHMRLQTEAFPCDSLGTRIWRLFWKMQDFVKKKQLSNFTFDDIPFCHIPWLPNNILLK